MSVQFTRDKLTDALLEWRDAGMSTHVLVDWIERFVAAKVDEIVRSRLGKGVKS